MFDFTDGKGITDTTTVNFIFTIENEEIQVGAGYNNKRVMFEREIKLQISFPNHYYSNNILREWI